MGLGFGLGLGFRLGLGEGSKVKGSLGERRAGSGVRRQFKQAQAWREAQAQLYARAGEHAAPVVDLGVCSEEGDAEEGG